MRKQRHAPEQIIRKLRMAEVELTKGQSAAEVARRSSNITYSCHPLIDSLPREHQVFSAARPVGDFGFGDGPFAREPRQWGRGLYPAATGATPNSEMSGAKKGDIV
jgi:hypothetical protein